MTDINQKLEILYDLLIDNFSAFKAELIDLILAPGKIKDTNKFASLLSDLKNPVFINPLLATISLSDKGDPWLTDFLYAAITLLEDSSEDEFDIPVNLIDKLQIWVLEYKNEIAWKAASLLKFYHSEMAETIQLKKLEERGDFFLTYVECILGLLWYDRDKHWPLLAQISSDGTRDEKLREFVDDMLKSHS